MKSCRKCQHQKICALYDAIWKAITTISEFDVFQVGYEEHLIEKLAEDCTSYYKEEF